MREVNPDVPISVAAIVDRLLEKVPSQRYQTANEVRDECLKLLSHPESINELLKPTIIRKNRNRVLVKSVLGLLAVSFVGNALFTWNWQNTKSYADSSETANRSKSVDSSETLERAIAAFQQSKNRIRTSGPVNEGPLQPTSVDTPKTTSHQLAPHKPTEQELWQTEFDSLEIGLQILKDSGMQQSSQSIFENSVDSSQVSFEQQLTQLKAFLSQLEAPAYEPIQNAPSVN